MSAPDPMTLTNSDWIALSSVAIAMCALFATAWQAWLARVHNRLTVTPRIASTTGAITNNDNIEISLVLENVGVGPAFIVDRYFTIDGRRLAEGERDPVEAICYAVFDGVYKYRIVQSGMIGGKGVMPAGAKIVIAKLVFPGLEHESKPAVLKVASRAEFIVEYKCLYGRKYQFHSKN